MAPSDASQASSSSGSSRPEALLWLWETFPLSAPGQEPGGSAPALSPTSAAAAMLPPPAAPLRRSRERGGAGPAQAHCRQAEPGEARACGLPRPRRPGNGGSGRSGAGTRTERTYRRCPGTEVSPSRLGAPASGPAGAAASPPPRAGPDPALGEPRTERWLLLRAPLRRICPLKRTKAPLVPQPPTFRALFRNLVSYTKGPRCVKPITLESCSLKFHLKKTASIRRLQLSIQRMQNPAALFLPPADANEQKMFANLESQGAK